MLQLQVSEMTPLLQALSCIQSAIQRGTGREKVSQCPKIRVMGRKRTSSTSDECGGMCIPDDLIYITDAPSLS